VLARLVTAVVQTPGGSIEDLYHALFAVLGDNHCELSREMANFIRDLVVKCFTEHRSAYEAVDWVPLVQKIMGSATKAQLYLALHSIPPQHVSAELAELIAKGLQATPFHQEALNVLAVENV
jgi:hypothetical protein